MLACEGSGEVPSQKKAEEQKSAAPTTHKVQLSAEQLQALEKSGAQAQLIADYGSFKLVQVDDKALASLPEGAEKRDEFNQILLNAGTIDTASAQGQALRGMKQQASGKRFHLVQFAGPIQPQWYKELEATGVQVVAYIPHNAYLVYGNASALNSLQQHVSAKAANAIQWDGAYLDDYKLDRHIQTLPTETYAIQLIKDEEANGPTLELINQLQSRSGTIQEALGYVNVSTYLKVQDLYRIAAQPDVVSIQPHPLPRKFDERQNMIVSGHLTGNTPSGPGWMEWLNAKGFSQAQFSASGFGVDVTDSGVDNATPATPNHFGLYTGGSINQPSRLVYARLEGTPNGGSTIQGCDGHGTLNAHIIGGYSTHSGAPYEDSSGFNYGVGVAPFVKVGSSVIFDPNSFTFPDYEDLQSRAYRDSMRISSNSWGASSPAYSADSQRYDALVRDAQPTGSAVPNPGNQEMVIVFAAGNDGSGASTVGWPGTAKNIITAGASENVQAFGGPDFCGIGDDGADNAHDIIFFSSRGPTADGRKKPDLMAPGTHVSGGVAQAAGQRAEPPGNPNGQALSCFDGLGVCAGPGSNFFPLGQQWYTASSGTSHSTPAIAGGAALLRQYFINQGVAPPSAAMTKGYLMNSARYMTGSGAGDNLWSNNQGMGLMDLGMAFDGIPRLLDDQNPANLFTATGQTRTFTGAVSDSTKPLRITLAWTDAPGSTTGNAWNNNLDLTVTVGGNTYRGNVFTGAHSTTGGSADLANNVESVFLPAGTTGDFTITVTAANITSDGVPGNASTLDQDFALVTYNACNDAPPAPTGVSATAIGNNRIDVSWTNNAADHYNVYRATTAGGPYTLVRTVTSSPFVDTGVSGGLTYFYVVRGALCAESPASAEVSATATGSCTLPPTFAGVASVTSTGAETCSTAVTWAAGTPSCGGTVSYSVYRSTTSGFTPSVANRIATGQTGTSFADDLNLSTGIPYYYVVRATETGAATVEETNTVQRSVIPTGLPAPGTFFDDMDEQRPPNPAAYWIPTTQAGSTGAIQLTSGCHYQSPTGSWRFGAANSTSCGGSYPNSVDATLVLGGNGTGGINGLTVPNMASPAMSFNVWYNFEAGWDGAWLVYSTAGANGPWTVIGDATSTTQPYIELGGYDGTISGITNRVWTNVSTNTNGSLKHVAVNLNALAGRTVWFGVKFHTDGSVVREGMYIDDVRLDATVPGECSPNLPPPGPAVSYIIDRLPDPVGAGEAATFHIIAQDAVGQPASTYTGTATLTSTDPQAQLPATATFMDGVASDVPVEFRTLGTQTITAADTGNTTITGRGSTTVTPGPGAALAFTTQPSDTVAGAAIAPPVVVTLVDRFGNPVGAGTNTVTIALGNNPGGSALVGTTTVSMVAGVATFNDLVLNRTGAGYTLVATSAGLTGATSADFRVTAAAASSLEFQTQPSSSIAGEPFTPAVTVAILDAFGNVSDSTANITLALGTNPTGTSLSGTTTVAAVNGVATFGDMSITRVGTGYTLVAASATLADVTSTTFDISPAAPSRVAFTRQPSNTIAGGTITPAVQATLIDRYGNQATQATLALTVAIGNNPSGGTLSGTTIANAVGGVATFANLSVDRAGLNYTLNVGASGLFADNSVGFDVLVGPPAQLAFTASPTGNVASGAAFTARVAVRDAGGNVVTNTPTQVTLSLTNAPGATLSGTTTATTVNGVATFTGLSIDRAGSGYTLQAAAVGLPSASSPAFGVSAGAPTALVFASQPGNTTAGAAIAPAVRVAVQDAQGNTVTASSMSITLALATNPSGGTLSGTRTVAASNGVATFDDLSIDRAGTGYTLRANGGTLTSTSTGFNVAAGAAARLVFRTAPANGTAGAPLGSVAVEIQDMLGNLITSSTAQVTVNLGGVSGGTLGGTTTVAAAGGVATFSTLVIQRAASGYTLTASATDLQPVTSGAFDIAPAAAARLAFTTQPGNTSAGTTISPAVRVAIQDAFGNSVSSAAGTISLALSANPSGGTLAGTTSAAAVNGVATFGDLSIARAGTGYTITASSGALTSATSSAFDITAGAGTRLVFRVAPSSTTAGATLGNVSVELQDANGNRVNSSSNVTVELQGGQGATLAGTTTVAASAGVAMFSDLSINRAGTGYRLVAHADQAASATSSAFNISHGPAAALTFTGQPSNSSAGRTISPAVRVTLQDAFGNVATSATDSVTVALGNNPRNGTLSGTRTVSAISGVATFSDLSINRKGEGYTLVASSGALTGATSAAFDITPGRGPKLVLSTVPSQVTAGEALPSIDVELQDELGNTFSDSTTSVALSLGDNTAGGQLFGRTTVLVANGVARFDGLILRKAGNGYTLVASAQGFESATSTELAVRPAAAASYALTFPASVTAGQEAALSAEAYDAFGNQAANYGGTVNVTSSDAAATLSSTATFVEGRFQDFKVTFKTAGLRTLTVTDSANASLKATAQLNVTPFAQPTVTLTEPVGGATVSGTVRISAEGGVAAGTTVAKLQILVDGKELASGTEATLSGNWNSEEAEGGSHVITAVVTDGAGNIVSSAPVIVFTEMGGCGCGATSGTEASFFLALLVLAHYVLGRRRKANAA